MLRGYFILLVLGLSATQVAGQVNLVPNGSFEEYTDCPSSLANELSFTGWYNPTLGTCDYFHACAFPSSLGVPTPAGVDAAEGEGMVFMGLGPHNWPTREYAAVELDSALGLEQTYELTVQLHLYRDDYVSIGSFGAYFSSDSATDYSLDHALYELPAQLQRDPNSIMSDFSIWYEWKDTLVAAGGERFMIIGNFLPENQVPHVQPAGGTHVPESCNRQTFHLV